MRYLKQVRTEIQGWLLDGPPWVGNGLDFRHFTPMEQHLLAAVLNLIEQIELEAMGE
jgi:hypothetical protein